MEPTLTLIFGTKPKPRAKGRPRRTVRFSPGPGQPPCQLSAGAFPIWQRCRELLEALGLWDDADSFQLARYSEFCLERMRLSSKVQRITTHQKLTSNKGKVYYQKRPEASRLEYLDRVMLQLEKELGLSRKSRRIMQRGAQSEPPKEDDDFFRQRS